MALKGAWMVPYLSNGIMPWSLCQWFFFFEAVVNISLAGIEEVKYKIEYAIIVGFQEVTKENSSSGYAKKCQHIRNSHVS